MATKAAKTIKTLASRMSNVKLPLAAFWLDNEDRILRLTDLKMAKSSQDSRSCRCEYTIEGMIHTIDGTLAYGNKYEVSVEYLYEDLEDAIAALEKRRRRSVMDRWKNQYSPRDSTQAFKIHLIKQYADLVKDVLEQNGEMVDANTGEPYTILKYADYVNAARNYYYQLLKQITTLKFPEFAEEEENEDD